MWNDSLSITLGQTEINQTQITGLSNTLNTNTGHFATSGTSGVTILQTGAYYIECGFQFALSPGYSQSNGGFFKLVATTNTNVYYSFARSRIENTNSHFGSTKLYFGGIIPGNTTLTVYGFKINNNNVITVTSGNIFISRITP